jgi:hypothetical protein
VEGKPVSGALAKIKGGLGHIGMAALALLALTALFHVFAIKPLESRLQRLEEELIRVPPHPATHGFKRVSTDLGERRIEAFYGYFDRREQADDWLAKLYGIATAAGLELKSADYRLSDSRQRIERYQISLPVTGSYTQIHAFLETALAEIPVLSLDHAGFRRKSAQEGRIEAEIVLTLHLLRK